MNKKITHISVVIVLSALLLTLGGLLPFWAPMMNQVFGLSVAAILVTIWAGFILTEQSSDEREMELTMRSGRIAYLIGLFVLTIALVVQGSMYAIDPWICVTIVAMVLGKFVARTYLE